MSEKDCGHQDEKRQTLLRRLILAIIALAVIVLFIIFLVWSILRPTKPHFILQDATIFTFNTSTPYLLTSKFQVTLSSENPNDRIGIYYDHVDAYALYRGQQVTYTTLLPPSYQGHRELIVWSPFLYGDSVPIAPYFGEALYEDQIAGNVMVQIKVNGRIRFRVGTFISGTYRLDVSCPAYISLVNKIGNNGGIPVGLAEKFQLFQNCRVGV